MLEFLEYVCNNIDNGMSVDVIYLDFRKAFDKVPHKRLMVKVKAHGMEVKYGVGLMIGLMVGSSG